MADWKNVVLAEQDARIAALEAELSDWKNGHANSVRAHAAALSCIAALEAQLAEAKASLRIATRDKLSLLEQRDTERQSLMAQIDYSCDLQRIIEDLCRGGPVREPKTSARRHYDMATAFLSALEATPAPQTAERVRVKPLEWKPLSNTGSESGFGGGRSEYTLIPTQNGWRVYGIPGESDGGTEFFTMETAKAAAQADFERRILSAIEATPPAPMVTEAMVEAALAAFKSAGRYASTRARIKAALTAAQEDGR